MLITSIAELKAYVAIDGNSKIATFTSFIKGAEQLYIVDLLGKAFYDEFLALYTASVTGEEPTPLSAENAALLPYIQRPLANYAMLKACVPLAVTFGEMGMRQQRADNNDPASRWLQEKNQFEFLKEGDLHADKLLEFLESNATDINDYATWLSTAGTKNSGFIVYGVAIANKHIDINSSRRVFLKLRPKLQEIERRMVPKWIGQAQYEDLVTKLKAQTLSDEEKDLVAKIEPIVCKRGLFMQLPFMRVQITENGIFVYSGTDDLYLLGKLAAKEDVKELRLQLADGEFGYLNDEENLRAFIADNIDDYPLIEASTAYTTPRAPGPTWNPADPDPDDKYFAV